MNKGALQSFNEPYRRHDWHSPEEPLLGVVTDSGGGDNAEGSPTTPNGQAQPSVFKPRRDTQEDRLAARIQHARMQGQLCAVREEVDLSCFENV